jgi:hypothetical protein
MAIAGPVEMRGRAAKKSPRPRLPIETTPELLTSISEAGSGRAALDAELSR